MAMCWYCGDVMVACWVGTCIEHEVLLTHERSCALRWHGLPISSMPAHTILLTCDPEANSSHEQSFYYMESVGVAHASVVPALQALRPREGNVSMREPHSVLALCQQPRQRFNILTRRSRLCQYHEINCLLIHWGKVQISCSSNRSNTPACAHNRPGSILSLDKQQVSSHMRHDGM